MNNVELREKLLQAKSLEEAREMLKDKPDDIAERVYEEIQTHRSSRSEKLDLDDLDAVLGGCEYVYKDGVCVRCGHCTSGHCDKHI